MVNISSKFNEVMVDLQWFYSISKVNDYPIAPIGTSVKSKWKKSILNLEKLIN